MGIRYEFIQVINESLFYFSNLGNDYSNFSKEQSLCRTIYN